VKGILNHRSNDSFEPFLMQNVFSTEGKIHMNRQVSFNPRNPSHSRHRKDEEEFLQYCQLLEANTFGKMQVNRHNKKCRSLKSNAYESLLGYHLEKLLWKTISLKPV